MIFFRSTFAELIAPFLITFGVMSFILVMQRVYTLVSLMVEKQFRLEEVGQTLFYLMPQIVSITIPLGVVGAVFVTVIRQSVDSEIICRVAAGQSLWRFAAPIVCFGFLAAGLAWINSVWVSPMLYDKYVTLQNEIVKTHADDQLTPGRFSYDFGEKAIQVGGRSPDNELFEIFIADREFRPTSSAILAERGRIELDDASKQVFVRLQDGAVYSAADDPKVFRTVDFEKLDYRLAFEPQGQVSIQRIKREPTLKIWERVRGKSLEDWTDRRWAVELFSRITLPWSCLVFAIAAIPMAIVDPRSGNSGSYLRAVFLVVTYYIIWIGFKDLVRGGNAPPHVLWLPLGLILCFGLFRMWQINANFHWSSLLRRRRA